MGQWTLDSIFDYDILFENPINPITVNFSGYTNSATINGFCGNTYETFYTPSNSENSIALAQTSWNPEECDESQSFEFAMYNLLGNSAGSAKNLMYTISDDGTTTSLELSYTTIIDGISEGVWGYFTKQNSPPEIIGEWFLYSLTSEGIHYDNNFGNLPINFLEETNGYSEFQGTSSCNGFIGSYDVNDQIIEMTLGGSTLLDCPGPRNGFEMTYLNLFNHDNFDTSTFTYDIQDTPIDQILTLTKVNGDSIVYGKIEPNSVLNRTWYLQTINSNGLTYQVSPESDAHLTLDPTLNGLMVETLEFYGSGDCNDYTGTYNQGNDFITITEFTQTTDICDPQTDFEVIYFSLLGDDTSNRFIFEIIDDGNNLVLTSIPNPETRSPGDTLIFSRQQLSVDDHEINNYNITLRENPVTSELLLNFNEFITVQSIEYTIYSIGGKTIKSSQLESDSIDVNRLISGLYFISFSHNNQPISTIKFIKK